MPSAAARRRSEKRHRGHCGDVLHDEHAHYDAAVKGIDLPAIRQELHQNDRAGKRQRGRDVKRGHGIHAERFAQQIAYEERECDLSEAGAKRDGSDAPHDMHVELQADDEQQHGDADLREQLDLAAVADPAHACRSRGDADHDVGRDQGLPEPIRDESRDRRRDQNDGE